MSDQMCQINTELEERHLATMQKVLRMKGIDQIFAPYSRRQGKNRLPFDVIFSLGCTFAGRTTTHRRLLPPPGDLTLSVEACIHTATL